MSSSQSVENLRMLAKFYKKNGIQFSVIAEPTQLATSFPVAISQTATFTYIVTPGRTLYITDFCMNLVSGATSEIDIEIPSGTVVFRSRAFDPGMYPVQFKTPLVSRTEVKFNIVLFTPTYNAGGYEV